MTRRAALPVIFFVSGAAALLFETLWFRLTGLTFGNTAWASAIVLAAFMAGLAIGNAISLRLRGTLRVYAALELSIALSGLALVFALGSTQTWFVPLFRVLPLNATRLVLAFLLLIVPTTLMGATLPTVVRALSESDENFGRVLGLLYGCNTLGAVAGSLLGELVLIRAIGIRGTGVVAAGLSICAACGALVLRGAPAPPPARTGEGAGAPLRTLSASFLAGFALLALEVLWFRLIVLFNFGSSLAFATMLAVVLLGIGGGALVTSMLMTHWPDADEWLPFASAASCVALILGYWGFAPSLLVNKQLVLRHEAFAVFFDSIRLMLPVSAISGFLFTAIGKRVEREVGDEKRATALVTLSNTIGAAIGSLVAAFVLIPHGGVERGLFVVAVVYAIVTLLTMRRKYAALIIAVAACVFFPFGVMRRVFLPAAVKNYGGHIVAVREGPIETAVYLRNTFHGETHFHRLFTNGYSMSGTTFASRRYMTLFADLALSLRPKAKSALLISYGVGVTAKALTEAKQLTSIDVVDVSRNILDMSEIVWPGSSNPLRDMRVRVHLEDGRFFLRTTDRRFDLITAEPPPPKSAGIVSLYTFEYFQLLRSRLTDNGVVTYWLPVYQLSLQDAQSLVAAFCGAFDDCTAWSGGGGEWILAGGRGPTMPEFKIVDPRIGIERPEQLSDTFIAGPKQLMTFAQGAKPLSDDFPLRLSPATTLEFSPQFSKLLDQMQTTERLMDGLLLDLDQSKYVEYVLTNTDLRILPRLMLSVDPDLEGAAKRAIARGERGRDLDYVMGVAALGDRDYARAEKLFTSCGVKELAALAHNLQK